MYIVSEVNIVKNKKIYNVKINDKSYLFDEDTILEYKILKGREIDEETLEKAKQSYNIHEYYEKALSYSLKYAKGSSEVYYYLLDKGLDNNLAHDIVDRLVEKKIIDDKKLIEALVYSYVRNHNGRLMIYEKLKQKKYDKRLIEEAISNIDYDLYIENLNALYEKIKSKYNKYDDYVRKNKIKQYLYQRGYDFNDIAQIDIK